MKKILLLGYYGFNNIGDEAVLASIIQALRNVSPEVEITVLSDNPERTEKQYGVSAINRWSKKGISEGIKECDLFISGGGSLLQDVTGSKSILYYLALIRLALWYQKPVMFYAQGIGPVKRSWARKLLARVVNRVDLITVRDEDSRDDLLAMGVQKPPIYVTADPVLGWESDDETTPGEVLCRAGAEKKPAVGVSLRDWEGLKLKEIAQVCDWLAERGFQVVLLPFHFPGDIAICRDVAKLMKQEHCLVKENLSPAEMMNLVGKMHLIIGMRLHALIMAAARGVPFVGLSYDPKVERFSRQVGQTAGCTVENLTATFLQAQVEQILANYRPIKRDLTDKTAELKVKARENALLVGKLLERYQDHS
ncbi:MAG: polysaccharide pyruvyl transferase CsaB [Bacillota bacterium]|jgi:polysaccharide pyruvyl transferase CsaB